MKWLKYISILLLISLGSCDCEQLNLQNSCPAPVSCWLPEGTENTEKNLQLSDFDRGSERGKCSLGTTACDEKGFLYCEGIVYPAEEVCDGFDNDCDGGIDEKFDVDHDGWTVCAGDCNDNNKEIHPEKTEECNGLDDNCDGVIPELETDDADLDGVVACFDCDDNDPDKNPNLIEWCDGKDNNCDDFVDENYADQWFFCGPDSTLGACSGGRTLCVEGEPICYGAVWDSQEVCDAVDNDCDGDVDELLIQECSSACGTGVEYCQVGEWINCDAPTPTDEICDGFDNNCDGEIDEGCLCITGVQQLCTGGTVDPDTLAPLNCGLGYQECEEGRWSPCLWLTNEEEECDNYDNDCDGIIDQLSEACGESTIGECRLGSRTCSFGAWGECTGVVEPTDEVCDELDNDCDGEIDEDLTPHEKVDIVFAIDGSGSMCLYTHPLAMALGQYASEFQDLEHRFSLVVFPFTAGNILNPGAGIPYIVITDLVPVDQFISILTSLTCDFPGYEPSYDVMHDLAHPNNPLGISWRDDAFPYIVMVADEQPQTWNDILESDVAQQTWNCTVGSCAPGDRFEVYVFTDPMFFSGWDEPTFYEPARLISLQPPIAADYVNKLKRVFTNICL